MTGVIARFCTLAAGEAAAVAASAAVIATVFMVEVYAGSASITVVSVECERTTCVNK